METLFQDLRYALRLLIKSPAFTSVAVLTLALGIGANTAIFTVVNGVLLRMLPIRDPQQLVVVGDPTRANGRSNGTPRIDIFSYPLYKELRDRNSVFIGLCAAASDHRIEVDAGQGGSSDERVTGRMVSGNYFSLLGVEPAAGRLLSDSDDTAENANPVVVLGYGYWQRKFALSPSILGKDIRLNGYPFIVVGVAPSGFYGDVVGEEMALFVPLSMQPEIVRGRNWRNKPGTSWLSPIGRLKPGMTSRQAEAEMNLILQQSLRGTYGAGLSADDLKYMRTQAKIKVVPGGGGVSELRGDYRIPLLLLMGIVGLVLLIACVNVANLLLARASIRGKEIGILFGLAPALRTLKVQVTPALKETTAVLSESRSRFGWGKGLVAGQVALSLLVLFAAGLLVRSLQNVMTQDFGYQRNRLVIARLDPTAAGYNGDRMKLLAEQLVTRIASSPGVRSVTYSANGLFAGSESGDAIIVPGFKANKDSDRVAMEDYVGPGYFGAVGIPILAGRGIEAQDTATSTRVTVVNEAMVKHFFGGQNPLGRQFTIDDPDERDKPFTVVGVSHNAKDHGSGLREEVRPRFYQAFHQTRDPSQIVLEAEVSGVPSAALSAIRGQIKAIDSRIPIGFVRTLDDLVRGSAGDQIALAKLSAFFAGLALLLACVGLYGIMSYTVAGRTREIGLRMALGARRFDVLQLVLREGMWLVGFGLAIGIPLSLASSRLLSSMLYGLKSTDPVSLFAVIAILAIVAVLAGYIPARRATKVDPMVALRYE
ncbi:MAG: hypothetical protein DMG60_16050 [Acidobacteria bacterium]|nr:MAG: hypothetical protein DMG60_16050 [Acidobacteriota bacterium]